MTTYGIDPPHALAVLREGRLVGLFNLPKLKGTTGLGQLCKLFNEQKNGDCRAFKEKMQIRPFIIKGGVKIPTGRKAQATMMANERQIQDALYFCGIPCVEVPYQTWQAAMLRGIKLCDSKTKSLRIAQALFPQVEFLNDHQADAALIAAYGERR